MKDGKLFAHGEPQAVITTKLMKDVYGIEVLIKQESEAGLYTIPIGI